MVDWLVAECAPDVVLRFSASSSGIRAIDFDLLRPVEGLEAPENPLLAEAVRQMRAYFEGGLRDFTFPLDPRGTEFQLRVWKQLETIPYGEIRSYSEIARAIE